MSQPNNLEIYVNQESWSQNVSIYIIGTNQNGDRFLVKPMDVIFQQFDPTNPVQLKPSIQVSGVLSQQFLPALRDAIIKAGYKDKQNDIEHIQNHLKDMQKIVFSQLKINEVTK